MVDHPKAHIEQTSASTETTEKILQINTNIERFKCFNFKAETKIDEIENAGANQNETIQTQIDREQERIDTAYS